MITLSLVVFRFVQLNSPNTENIQKKFKVPLDIETLLLFNENVNRSVASLSMADIPIKTMQDVIDNNKYLVLPRLSSQVCGTVTPHLGLFCLPISWQSILFEHSHYRNLLFLCAML